MAETFWSGLFLFLAHGYESSHPRLFHFPRRESDFPFQAILRLQASVLGASSPLRLRPISSGKESLALVLAPVAQMVRAADF
ncbi:hypothetical protein MPNT_130035 [Candidatus Methylacidithermus pantelleriae]|uniref:Uncharacterized protein n=1 Tax=Candidatus Methylacidithermus pantelleriae TaxID=2744239 RepID=A0A8J2BKF3_9BACT|nr:hypothetical protein MPNT_130035 [Candidatus Methylacidithermus pantelleriae]